MGRTTPEGNGLSAVVHRGTKQPGQPDGEERVDGHHRPDTGVFVHGC